jgi:hypothetical protein
MSGKDIGAAGAVMLAAEIPGNGALSCEDGKCYHEWQLNPRFGATKRCQSCRGNLQELSLAEVALKYGASEDQVLQGMGCDICSTAMNSHEKWPVHHCASEDCNWDMCKECFDIPEYKYISTDPDVKGQEKDPGVRFGNVVCLHCNKVKDQHSDKGAMSSLHVGMNSIPEKEMKEIITIAMRKDSMKILCEVPIKDKTLTELDISGKDLGMEGALVVAEYLDGNGALTSLNFSSNNLKAKGAKIVAKAIKVTNCVIAIILAPFPCPSGHWLNCCCLLLSTG